MALTAEIKNGRDTGSSDTLSNGLTKKIKFWVNTRDELAAMSAPGIPKVGDPYGPSRPGLVVTGIDSKPLGGIDNGSGENGRSEVIVTYGIDNRQISTLPPGTKHTVISINNESVDAGCAVTDAGQAIKGKNFNNNKSASKLVGRISAEVYDYRANNYAVPFVTLIGLATDKALNSDNIQLPAPIGLPASATIALAPKQALYMGFKVEATPSGTIVIVHELQLALDFQLRWAIPDKDGKILQFNTDNSPQPAISGQLYRAAAFAGLW